MKLFKSKKRVLAVGLTAALVAGMTTAAFAYFTSTGDGSGTATVGTSTTWAVTTDAAVLTGDAAGLTPQPDSCRPSSCAVKETVAYRVKNNSSGQQHLANVAVSIANANGYAWTSVSGCSASDFSIDGLAAGTTKNDTALAANLAAGATTSDGTITIVLIDNGSSQDGCKSASVPLYLHAT